MVGNTLESEGANIAVTATAAVNDPPPPGQIADHKHPHSYTTPFTESLPPTTINVVGNTLESEGDNIVAGVTAAVNDPPSPGLMADRKRPHSCAAPFTDAPPQKQ